MGFLQDLHCPTSESTHQNKRIKHLIARGAQYELSAMASDNGDFLK